MIASARDVVLGLTFLVLPAVALYAAWRMRDDDV